MIQNDLNQCARIHSDSCLVKQAIYYDAAHNWRRNLKPDRVNNLTVSGKARTKLKSLR
jgi:hypothetical protein